jgi:prepilin-type N-terminal cleavage/methylation domain-containing protein
MIQTPTVRGSRQRGFTLIEVMVSLIVTVIVLLGVLALFDFSNRLSRVQTNISDMQQSLRVAQSDMARLVRMAGAGDLPQTRNDGPAVTVTNNVADSRTIADPGGLLGGGGTAPAIVPGSDVLTIRGVFTTPIYQVNSGDGTAFSVTPAPPASTDGTVTVSSKTPTGVNQDLSALKDAISNKRPEAIVLVNPRAMAVVELDPANSKSPDANTIVVAFKIKGGQHTDDYAKLSGGFPAGLTSVNSLGLLEEYRFYVRRENAIPGDTSSDLLPKLSRARAYPNTTAPWDNKEENWKTDIADNIFDFQVALGFDSPAADPSGSCTGGKISADSVNCSIYESKDGENDDWMYNGGTTKTDSYDGSRLYYVRLSTLARSDRRDKDYESPKLVRMEDNNYDSSPFNTTNERMYRHRILRTIIDMRNL